MKSLLCQIALLSSLSLAAHAEGMTKIFECGNRNALIEVYGPAQPAQTLRSDRKTEGFYALDLSAENKGKPLEPVLLSLSQDGRSVIVEQYTRGLPPTAVPLAGGRVDFDHRFAEGVYCRTL